MEANDQQNTAKRLTRSRSDRVIGGVCGGLGRYFNVDPLLFRIGAVALVFLGGAGLLLYLAALLLVPNEDQAEPVAPERAGQQPRARDRGRGGAAGRRLALSSRRRTSLCGDWDPARRSGRCRRARVVARLGRRTQRRRRRHRPARGARRRRPHRVLRPLLRRRLRRGGRARTGWSRRW